jgi:hypothetical protein
MVQMVFEWGELDVHQWDALQAKCQRLKTKPAWYPYLKYHKANVWDSFTVEEQTRAAAVLKRDFEALVDPASADRNLLLFIAFEQQGSNFVADLLPEYRQRLNASTWEQVIQALASLAPGSDDATPAYDRKQGGGLRRSFFRGIKQRPCGGELVASLRHVPPRGRTGWQLLWRLMTACASLKNNKYDFGKALDDVGVIDFLKRDYGLGGDAALQSWQDRQERFSDFVKHLPGIGWNTFDYLLRDLPYRGCLSLFKLGSNNSNFVEKVLGVRLKGNRTKYLEVLAGTGILDEYPVAVVNIAIFAFTSRNYLGYAKMLSRPTLNSV